MGGIYYYHNLLKFIIKTLIDARSCRAAEIAETSIFSRLKQAINMRRRLLSHLLSARRRRTVRTHIHGLMLECVATSFARPPSDSVSLSTPLSTQSSWLSSQKLYHYKEPIIANSNI